jgi:2-polyprenyl-6-hydroxyphenyl methylase/3-demethylubiquinone-9 3-methyltransferase
MQNSGSQRILPWASGQNPLLRHLFSASRICERNSYNAATAIRALSSVSNAEVSKFSDLSKSWWDPRKNPLIGMNAIRVEYIVNQTRAATSLNEHDDNHHNKTTPQHSPPLKGIKALDVGCGGGLLSESLARLGARVTAVDPSLDLVAQAKQHAQLDPKTQSIDYRGGCTVEELAQEIERSQSSEDLYDVICLLEVVEHVTDLHSILSSASSLLKPDSGRLFVSTINRTVKSKIIAIFGAEYIMRYLPPGTHDWNQFRSPAELQVSMNQIGLEQIDVQGMVITRPPFFGQWHWKLDPVDVDINWIGTYRMRQA